MKKTRLRTPGPSWTQKRWTEKTSGGPALANPVGRPFDDFVLDGGLEVVEVGAVPGDPHDDAGVSRWGDLGLTQGIGVE